MQTSAGGHRPVRTGANPVKENGAASMVQNVLFSTGFDFQGVQSDSFSF